MPNESSSPAANDTNTRSAYIVGFDSIRFFAASVVIFCHIELVKYYRGLPSLVSDGSAYETGKVMLAAFLVLSGFVITTLLLKEKDMSGSISLLSFYARRCLRIWPLYYLLIAIIFFILPHFSVFYLPVQSEELQQHFLLKFVFSMLLMSQMLLIKFRSVPGGEQLWTIGTEEIFYFIWPLVMLKSKNLLRLTISVIVLIIAVKLTLFTFSGYTIWSKHPGLLYRAYLVFYYNRIDCILLGVVAAILVHRKYSGWLKLVSTPVYARIVLLIILALFIWGLKVVHVDYFYYALCSAWLISFVAVAQNRVESLPLNFSERMGKATYGIYIWHYIMLLLAFGLLNYFFAEADRSSIMANVFLYLTTYLLTYGVAIFSYRFIEGPFLRMRVKFRSKASM